jgi:hypothetical protein
MKRNTIAKLMLGMAAGLLVVVTVGQVSLQAQSSAAGSTLPPFKVQAKTMQLDTRPSPAHLVYQTNVKFTSTMNEMNISCDRLEANFSSTDNVSNVTATGNVLISMSSETGDAASANKDTTYKYSGKAGKVVYLVETPAASGGGVPAPERVIRLSKLQPTDPQPSLHVVSTDQKTKQTYQTDLLGDFITYHLNTGVLDATEVTTESPGAGQ